MAKLPASLGATWCQVTESLAALSGAAFGAASGSLFAVNAVFTAGASVSLYADLCYTNDPITYMTLSYALFFGVAVENLAQVYLLSPVEVMTASEFISYTALAAGLQSLVVASTQGLTSNNFLSAWDQSVVPAFTEFLRANGCPVTWRTLKERFPTLRY